MENKEKCGCGTADCKNTYGSLSNCMNGYCGHGNCRWLKKLLVLFVIIMAFWLGECVGQIKGEMHSYYKMNRGMMYSQDGFKHNKMMGDYQKSGADNTNAAPEAPVQAN